MAENNERAELKGTIAGQSFSLNTKDIISVLLLLAGALGGYLIFIALDDRITTLTERQERILTAAAAHKDAVIEALHAHRALLVEEVHAAQLRQAAQSEELRRLIQVHDFNMGRAPGEHLPLDVSPEMLPPRRPPGP
jgi:hypothetical protein